MANRKTFNDFKEDRPNPGDYLIGFSDPVPGGERRFRLADLKGFMHPSEVVQVTGQVEFSSQDVINGKIYHIENSDTSNTEPLVVSLPLDPPHLMEFAIVNKSESNFVKIQTRVGEDLQARGNILRKKYDTAIIYWDGTSWNGYGDLSQDGGMHIKNISQNYTFTHLDADSIFHVKSNEDVKINLPNPTGILSGTQFYIYNLSDNSKVILNSSEVELSARSNTLRRKYDDVVVYTDGIQWFATGDLS